jgi:hypothetical protein
MPASLWHASVQVVPGGHARNSEWPEQVNGQLVAPHSMEQTVALS